MTAPLALLALMTPAPGSNPLTGFLVQIVLIIAIFYFIVIRPQQRQRSKHEQALRELKRGDEVVTAGGIIGEVVHIKEGTKDGAPAQTMEDRVTIKSGESRLVVERGRIARVGTKSVSEEVKAT
jgi:preprotein translocase subunit YajC